MKNNKRLFFGAEVDAPWPSKLPSAHILPEAARHITLVFLGHIPFNKLEPLRNNIPLPSNIIELTAWCNQIIFLPLTH